jgi:PEP-CTERM motif
MHRLIPASAGLLFFAAAPACAAITAVTGNIALVSPPASVRLDATQSDDHAIAFDERQFHHFVTTKWDVNAIPGLYDQPSDLRDGYLDGSVAVQSHLFHADPVTGSLHVQGTITFDHRILAIALSEIRLEQTESAGLSTVSYPPYTGPRGIELAAGDFFRIDSDGRTLEIDATATVGTDGFDQMRILTLASNLAGDYNGDGTVDNADYLVWKNFAPRIPLLSADGNGNNVLDAADYTIWRDHLGATIGAAAGSTLPVPEPSTAWLLLSALLLGFLWRGCDRRRVRSGARLAQQR